MTPPISVLPLSCLQINTVVWKFHSEFSYCTYHTLQPLSSMFLSLYLQVSRQARQGYSILPFLLGKHERLARFQRGLPQRGSTATAKLCGGFSSLFRVVDRHSTNFSAHLLERKFEDCWRQVAYFQ